MSYIIPILGLLGLVFLHELGHFTAAKRTGMRALKFYVGFPPPLVRKRVGETEYGIGVVPLGGFVKIPGMLRPEPSDLWAIEDLLHRSESLPPERASEIGIAYDRLAQLVAQGRVDEAAPAAGELSRLIDETEGVTAADRRRVSRCLSRFLESTDPRGYWRSSRPKRLIVIGAGPLANILFAFLLLTGLAVTGLPQPLQPTAVVAGLEKGLPAQKAGLRAHDRIVAIDGHPITGFDQVRALISTSGGHPVSLTVRRNGTTVHLGPITPVKQGGRYIVGFLPDVIATTRSVPVWKAPGEGASQMWTMISGSVTGIRSEGTSSLSGPVGIVRVSASRRRHRRALLPVAAGLHLAVARHPQPAAVPAAGRRPHPAGRAREDPRRTAAVAGDVRARVDGGHRAGAVPVPVRAAQRSAGRPAALERRRAEAARRYPVAQMASEKQITVGGVPIGGGAPVAVQSMTTTETADVEATLAQARALAEAGCDLVRVAVPGRADADALPAIVAGSPLPVIADIHFNASLALRAMDAGVAAVRINPGNIGGPDKVEQVVQRAKQTGTPMRIGANSGSLPDHLRQFATNDPAGALVEAALEEVRLLERLEYREFKISVKSSSVPVMVQAYQRLSERVPYPLHLGVTEAGPAFTGTVKSSIGIGSLLGQGIGDTIRVSLTADPVEEVRVAWEILRSLGLRQRGPMMIACPSCGRTNVDVLDLAEQVEARLGTYDEVFEVAVMGCAVNGPGEAGDADFGIAGGRDAGFIYAHGLVLRKVEQSQLVDELFREVDAWIAAGMVRPKRGTRKHVLPMVPSA